MFSARFADMAEDLAEFAVVDVEDAIRAYRCDPKAKFFPNSGQLRHLAAAARKDRAETAQAQGQGPQFGESRPIMWWAQSRRLWKPHWREEEIPEEYRATYFARKAKGLT